MRNNRTSYSQYAARQHSTRPTVSAPACGERMAAPESSPSLSSLPPLHCLSSPLPKPSLSSLSPCSSPPLSESSPAPISTVCDIRLHTAPVLSRQLNIMILRRFSTTWKAIVLLLSYGLVIVLSYVLLLNIL